MLTILEAIKLSTEYLEKKGIEEARLNVELMLAEILSCKRLDLYLKFEQPLRENEVNKLREWIALRGKSEPLQYILGNVEFYGTKFLVNQHVLIPRQETEILVETIILQNKKKENLKILDIGTGSGIIPVILSNFLIDAKITAIDNSEMALQVARHNAEANNVINQINYICADIFNFNSVEKYDLIVSNPPYVSITEYSLLQKEIVEYEPRQAVTDYADGYKFYKFICNQSCNWLNSGGRLYFEVGKDQVRTVKEYLSVNSFVNVNSIKDLQNIERVVFGEKI